MPEYVIDPIYDVYPSVDQDFNFGPDIRVALANSKEMADLVERLLSTRINNAHDPKWGIKRDGSDEAVALQAFLNASAGGYAYFPPGTYVSSVTLNPKSNSTVMGAGRGATVLSFIGNKGSQNTRLQLLNVTNVTVRDLTATETNVSGRDGNYGVISGSYTDRVTIENCEVVGSSTTGIHFMRSTNLLINANVVHDTRADGIHVQRNSQDVRVTNNRVYDVSDDCIGFVSHAQSEGQCMDIIITGNSLGPSKAGLIGSGVALIGILGAVVVGNMIKGVGSAGVRITSINEPEDGGGFAVSGNILVEGNQFRNVGGYTGSIAGQQLEGICVYNSRNVDIKGNTINGTGTTGISVSQCSIGVTVDDNEITRAGSNGIFVALLERSAEYLVLWSDSKFWDGRNKDYVSHHELTITNNRITAPQKSGIIVQGQSSRYLEDVDISDNTVKYPNQSNSAGQAGINTTYINELTLKGNRVTDSLTSVAFTHYTRSNVINAYVTENRPAANGQVTLMGKVLHTSGSIAPTSGSWAVGTTIWNDDPHVAEAPFSVCVIAGTMGTLGATTAAALAGTSKLTLSSASGLGSGAYIRIAGISGMKRIIALQGNIATLDSPVDATISAGAVTFSAASFRNAANLV